MFKQFPSIAGWFKLLDNPAAYLPSPVAGRALRYLLQRDHPDQVALTEACRAHLTAGYAKLDPALPADRLVTTWRVWVPASELREPARPLARATPERAAQRSSRKARA